MTTRKRITGFCGSSIIVLLLLCPGLLWAGPTFVGGATSGGQCASATTCTINYTPTNGNTVVVCLAVSSSVTGATVQDSTTAALTAGSTQLNATSGTGVFYYTAGSGVTSFTGNWTTARNSTIIVAEYSGVSSVTGTPGSGTANGNSTALSVSPTANESGDFAVACGARNSGTTQTANVGNLREEIHAASPGTSIADAVATGATATNVATTAGSSGTWTSSALILRTAAATGTIVQGPVTFAGPTKH